MLPVIPIISYTLIDALSFLKSEIERLEKRMKEEKNEYYRRELESLIEWNFERGLKMMGFAKPGEINQEVIDFFLDRIKERPDLKKLEKLLEKEESRNWLERIWDRIRWRWIK